MNLLIFKLNLFKLCRRQISGSTSPGIIPPQVRSVVPQSQDLVQSDKFQVMVDVSHFTPEEISVKTVDNTVVVTAKHEDRADDFGYISRQFSRKYLLPADIDPLTVNSSLSAEGILTIQVTFFKILGFRSLNLFDRYCY